MGKGDYRWKEAKKPKKDAKKIVTAASVLQPTPEVEVIKVKGKKEKPPEEE